MTLPTPVKIIAEITWIVLKEGVLPLTACMLSFYLGGFIAYCIAGGLCLVWWARHLIKGKLPSFIRFIRRV